MKNFINYVFALFLILLYSSKAVAIEQELIQNKSQLVIASKYAEKFCSAKDDNFFEGLDNERILKYSYLKYMGFQNEEIYSKDMYNQLVLKIKEKCLITNQEEKEIREFFLKEKSNQ